MEFKDRLQVIRKKNKLSQENLADKLGLSRQAVAKWENGQSYPDILNLIQLSELLKVTIDTLVKDNDECSKDILSSDFKQDKIIDFLCEAKKNTYAAHKRASDKPTRPNSHDLYFNEGEMLYIDTYLGSEKFVGEEAIWLCNQPLWAMNYSGRVLHETFSSNFLKEALSNVTTENPFRGPTLYRSGDYTYHCNTNGDFNWFNGKEEIYCNDLKVYECYFHGGEIK